MSERDQREAARRRRARSIAIALVLAAVVVLFYVMTIVRLGGSLAERQI